VTFSDAKAPGPWHGSSTLDKNYAEGATVRLFGRACMVQQAKSTLSRVRAADVARTLNAWHCGRDASLVTPLDESGRRGLSVSVQKDHIHAPMGQMHGQIRGNCRFAHPTFFCRDQQDHCPSPLHELSDSPHLCAISLRDESRVSELSYVEQILCSGA
jgi:hypothetical protein